MASDSMAPGPSATKKRKRSESRLAETTDGEEDVENIDIEMNSDSGIVAENARESPTEGVGSSLKGKQSNKQHKFASGFWDSIGVLPSSQPQSKFLLLIISGLADRCSCRLWSRRACSSFVRELDTSAWCRQPLMRTSRTC